MYLEYDYYLPKDKACIENDKEMYELLVKAFPDLVLEPVKGSYRTGVLCLMMYIGYCASCYELSALFGSYFSSAPVRTRLAELSSKKSGVLGALGYSNNDMGAQRAYFITKQGYVSHLSAIPELIKPKGGEIKIRRSGGLVPTHDYGVGISLYSFLLSGLPFYYEKEDTYSIKTMRKQKGSVCVDCTIYLRDNNSYRIYLEQDMGNETTTTLINKIGAYKRLGLADACSCIVFSSHSIMPFSSCATFSPVALDEIFHDMESRGCDGLYEYFSTYGDDIGEDRLLLLKKLLVRTGVCDACLDGIACVPEKVTAGCVLKRHLIYSYCNKVETGSRLSDDFTLSELKRYISELRSGCNPYRLRCYNMEQARITKQKFRNMALTLSGHIANGYVSRDDISCLLSGYACYMVPSMLLDNAVPLINVCDRAYMNKCRKAVSAYYPGIMDCAYSERSDAFYFEDYDPVVLRNACALPDGRTVCFEHIGKDVGAFVRCYYLCMVAKAVPGLKVHIVALCDNDEDMVYFCKCTRYYMKYSRFPEKYGFYISFLTETELEDDCCLLRGIDNPELPVPVYVRTRQQAEELLSGASVPRQKESSDLSLSQLFSL